MVTSSSSFSTQQTPVATFPIVPNPTRMFGLIVAAGLAGQAVVLGVTLATGQAFGWVILAAMLVLDGIAIYVAGIVRQARYDVYEGGLVVHGLQGKYAVSWSQMRRFTKEATSASATTTNATSGWVITLAESVPVETTHRVSTILNRTGETDVISLFSQSVPETASGDVDVQAYRHDGLGQYLYQYAPQLFDGKAS